MTRPGLLSLLVLLTSAAHAAEVPETIPKYKLVRVKLDPGERCFVLAQNLVAVETATTNDGLVFTGAPGRYAILAFTDNSTSQLTCTITDDGPSPPGPGPGPGPQPDDPVPATFGLTKIAREARAQIGPDGQAFIGQVAMNFDAAASAIAVGGISSIATALESVQQANRATWGTSGGAAWTNWLYTVGDAVDALQKSGRIKTVKDYGRALAEIGAGLRS